MGILDRKRHFSILNLIFMITKWVFLVGKLLIVNVLFCFPVKPFLKKYHPFCKNCAHFRLKWANLSNNVSLNMSHICLNWSHFTPKNWKKMTPSRNFIRKLTQQGGVIFFYSQSQKISIIKFQIITLARHVIQLNNDNLDIIK